MASNTPRFDPRITAARADLAAAALRGHVEAERFAEGERFTVLAETVDVKRRPRPDAPLETQLLYGETLVVYDEDDGWGWAQSDRDGYVGYVAMSALGRSATTATHRVIVNRTFVYPAPDMKQPPVHAMTLDARVRVEEPIGAFARINGRGFMVASHLAPTDATLPDYVTVAERLLGVPYLWGGKSPLGIDCSGLVQLACSLCGHHMPRDSDMQERMGTALPLENESPVCVRGDLVFWPGHVGIMTAPDILVHANAHHMLVMREPLQAACERIFASSGMKIGSIRRLSALEA